MKLTSYVVKHDTGFAPNPYYGFLTLATCKPKIRQSANIGDILVGTGSARGVGNNKIIYVGVVSDVLSTIDYSIDPRFEAKKPSNQDEKAKRGDNIYYWQDGQWQQIKNISHGKGEIYDDLQPNRILVCEKFWYLGNQAKMIPEEFLEIVKIGPGHKNTIDETLINDFMKWIGQFPRGVMGEPSSLSFCSSDKIPACAGMTAVEATPFSDGLKQQPEITEAV